MQESSNLHAALIQVQCDRVMSMYEEPTAANVGDGQVRGCFLHPMQPKHPMHPMHDRNVDHSIVSCTLQGQALVRHASVIDLAGDDDQVSD